MSPKLFLSENDLRDYLPVNLNLRFETVASYLSLAEENYILPLLGDSLFNRIVEYFEDGEIYDNMDTLMHKIRFAIVRLAIWKGFDVINSNISDTGFASDVDKDNRLFRYQEENLKTSLKNEGFDYLDNVLAFIDVHIEDFPEFKESDYYKSIENSLIRKTSDFNSCYNIGNSRLVFLKMRQYVRDVELIKLQHRIGAAFFKELTSANAEDVKYSFILQNIKRFIVYAAVAEGIGELHKMPTEKGLIFESSNLDGTTLSPIERTSLMETKIQFSEKAERYLASAINYIQQHKSEYPKYTSFAPDSPADGVIRFDNTNRKIFMT